jgi:serine/threonine protein kinase
MEVELSRELLRSAVEKWPTFSALFLRRIMIINRAQRPRAGFQIVVVMILKDCRVEQRQEGKPARTFLVGKPLGSGSFATVYEANEGGKGSATQIALKVVSKEALTPDL